MRRWMLAIMVCLIGASSALAEPPEPPAALQVLKAARNKGKKPDAPAAQHDTESTRPDRVLGHPDDGAKHAALDAMRAAARRTKRDHARRQRHQQLRKQFKGKDVPNSVRVELRTHARRTSRLRRIRGLAGDDAALIARVDALIEKETARHERHMAVLSARAPQPPARPADDREQDDEVEE